jgi:hypothetical protein
MKNICVARVFTYKLKCILLVFVLINCLSKMLAAQAPIPQGIFQRLIKIKYNTELYLISAAKHAGESKKEMDLKIAIRTAESLDSTLAIYNTIRWNVDGLVYQLSGDLVAANSPKKLRQLNDWCLNQSLSTEDNDESIEGTSLKNIERLCKEYLPAFSPIGKTAGDQDQNQIQDKNINLTTNVFYLIKDSYSLIKGLSDLKTQKTTALVEILDQMRLASPQELLKQVK